MCSGSAIKNNERTSCRAHLNARCVASVPSRTWAGLSYGTAGAPELYAHLADIPPDDYSDDSAMPSMPLFKVAGKEYHFQVRVT
jgi:hypothetical protein